MRHAGGKRRWRGGCSTDRLGVGASLSSAVPPAGERAPAHDRGKVLTQAMLMLAGGGECVSACAPRGRCSPTWRRRRRSHGARGRRADQRRSVGGDGGRARRRVGAPGRRGGFGAVTLDIDATLIEVHSENKQGTAAHYKGGFGFHPLLCFSDDGDALAALLRPGNAAANSIADHIELLDAAIGQLPAAVGAGHHVGDDAADAARPLRVRADSAGCSVHIAQACRDRNVGFSLVARANDAIDAAIAVALADADRWQGAIRQNGDSRRGAAVGPHRPRRHRRLAPRDAPHRAPRTPPRGRATVPVPQRRLPLLGPLDRPRRRRRRPRRAHARPRPRRRPHQKTQILRTHPHALQQPHRQHQLGTQRLCCPHRNGSARCGTPPPASAPRRHTIRLPANHPGAAHLARIYNHITALR